jgi:chemotaxis signal transduction protein
VRSAAAREALQALVVRVGGLELALPLDCVRGVLLMPATRPLPGSPGYLNRFFELHGEPVRVLDLARRFGVPHAVGHLRRQLVVVEVRGRRLALCVDGVEDPREFPSEDVRPREELGGGDAPAALREALRALLRTPGGFVPLLAPEALVAPGLLDAREAPTPEAAR